MNRDGLGKKLVLLALFDIEGAGKIALKPVRTGIVYPV